MTMQFTVAFGDGSEGWTEEIIGWRYDEQGNLYIETTDGHTRLVSSDCQWWISEDDPDELEAEKAEHIDVEAV